MGLASKETTDKVSETQLPDCNLKYACLHECGPGSNDTNQKLPLYTPCEHNTGSRCIVPPINLGTTWKKWFASCLGRFILGERALGTHCMGPTAGLDILPLPGFATSIIQPIA